MAGSGFTVDKVSWHASVKGNPETFEQIVTRFKAIALFLQENALLKEGVFFDVANIGADFQIHSDHLSIDGLKLMKTAYSKWLRSIDRGGSPENIGLLKKELEKIRI